jgi:serine/threonine protein kinase
MRVRCPDCRYPIEVTDDAWLAEMKCPECEKVFNLISGQSTCTFYSTERVVGHFELLEEVGSGAFGVVWKARDTQLDRTVAIKIQRRGIQVPHDSERFLRDAKAAAKLRHPAIATVYEIGLHQELLYIAGEYIEGANLKEYLSCQRVTPREAAEITLRVAEALQHAHNANVVHRDLKPANIMIDLEGRPHVIDFGLAKRDAGDVTVTVEGVRLGTPAYMSPEQARGDAHYVDGRSDVYSIGVILFELLTGERPFRGDERMLYLQLLRDEPPRPRSLNSRVPRELEIVALKCLQKEPRKRYQTADELAVDLRAWLNGEGISARPPSALSRLTRWCLRFERIFMAGNVGLLLLAIFFLWTASGIWNLAVGSVSTADNWRSIQSLLMFEVLFFPLAAWNSWFAAKGRLLNLIIGVVSSAAFCVFSTLASLGHVFSAGGLYDDPAVRLPAMNFAVAASAAALVTHCISIAAYIANRDVIDFQRQHPSRQSS